MDRLRNLISEQRNFLVLHNEEWQRLKKKAGTPESPRYHDKEQYLKSLKEKSQKWLKSWPDTIQGHAEQLAKEDKQHRAEQIAMIKLFRNKKHKDETKQAINKARQMIFESSCYGHQLRSALLESKALEENDAQISFKNKLKQKSLDMVPDQYSEHCSFDLDKKHVDGKRSRQLVAKELAQFNKNIHESAAQQIAKNRAEEVKDRYEDAIAIERMNQIENEEKEKCKILQKNIFHESYAEQIRLKTERARRHERDQIAADKYKVQQDQLRERIRKVYHEIHHGKAASTAYQNHFKLLEDIKEEEQKRYDQFIEKGIKKLVERERNKQELSKASKHEPLAQADVSGTTNHLALKENKALCSDRQCILPKCGKTKNKKKGCDSDDNKSKLAFLEQRETLTEELRKREKEPPPWTGAKETHAHFAQYADDVLKLCQYKGPARKVVNEYLKFHGLSAAALPIPNYEDI